MFAANTYLIRLATDDDAVSLRRIAEVNGRGPLPAPALLGHVNGKPAAAISVASGQIVADPFYRTDHLLACLRVRANALRSVQATPSLRMRMLAGLSTTDHSSSAQEVRPPERVSAKGRTTVTASRRLRHPRTRVPCVA